MALHCRLDRLSVLCQPLTAKASRCHCIYIDRPGKWSSRRQESRLAHGVSASCFSEFAGSRRCICRFTSLYFPVLVAKQITVTCPLFPDCSLDPSRRILSSTHGHRCLTKRSDLSTRSVLPKSSHLRRRLTRVQLSCIYCLPCCVISSD